jgi:hypothetical protein
VNNEWVVTFTFDVDPSMEAMDLWETELASFEGSVARVPDRGVDVTVFAPGHMTMLVAAEKMSIEVAHVVGADPVGAEILTEAEWTRRAEAPTIPELMSAAEIADELEVSRQRVHQLRSTAAFPAPLADLRGGAVWDAAAIRKFNEEWRRKPGRPRLIPFDERERRYVTTIRELTLPDTPHLRSDVVLTDEGGQVLFIGELKRTNIREVVLNPDGGWDVRKPEASRASAHCDTQQEAIYRARRILQNRGGGELRVRGRDGEVWFSDEISDRVPWQLRHYRGDIYKLFNESATPKFGVAVTGESVLRPVQVDRIDARSSRTFIAVSAMGMGDTIVVRWHEHEDLSDEQSSWTGTKPPRPPGR